MQKPHQNSAIFGMFSIEEDESLLQPMSGLNRLYGRYYAAVHRIDSSNPSVSRN